MNYHGKEVGIIKLLQEWREKFEKDIEGEDYYYTHIHKDRDEDRLLENLSCNPKETIDDLFEYGKIPEDADIYVVKK